MDKLSEASFQCIHCGSYDIEIPKRETADSHVLTCNGCGKEVARWGDVREHLLANVADAARKAFSKIPGFR